MPRLAPSVRGTLILRLGPFGVVTFAQQNDLETICLTAASHDLVPFCESFGFAPDDNEQADTMREAGAAGPMTLVVPEFQAWMERRVLLFSAGVIYTPRQRLKTLLNS